MTIGKKISAEELPDFTNGQFNETAWVLEDSWPFDHATGGWAGGIWRHRETGMRVRVSNPPYASEGTPPVSLQPIYKVI